MRGKATASLRGNKETPQSLPPMSASAQEVCSQPASAAPLSDWANLNHVYGGDGTVLSRAAVDLLTSAPRATGTDGGGSHGGHGGHGVGGPVTATGHSDDAAGGHLRACIQCLTCPWHGFRHQVVRSYHRVSTFDIENVRCNAHKLQIYFTRATI